MSQRIETVLDVEGMTCGACVRHVGAALRGVPGVDDVEVDLRGARARVRHAEDASLEAMRAAVRRAGYDAAPAGG